MIILKYREIRENFIFRHLSSRLQKEEFASHNLDDNTHSYKR